MKKRVLGLAMALGLLTGVCTGCSNTAKEDATAPTTEETNLTENVDWKSLYTDFIVTNKDEQFPNINYIGLNDLNFDGVPELMLSDSAASAAATVGVFQIQDGEVKLLYGYSSMASEHYMTETDPIFYSNFHNNWLTLRKNVNTGELRYFLISSNGSGSESFGDTFSFPVNKNNEIGVVSEFGYVILYDDETYEMTDEFYYVLGEQVTSDKYLQTQAEIESNWEDTGVRTPAMTNGHYEYSHSVELSLEKEDLENFFDLYEKEY